MNGIDKITQRITQEIEREIATLEDQVSEQASAITADYAVKAVDIAEEIKARGEKAAQEREERLVSMAHMEARKAQLAVKQEVLEEAFALALEKLCTLPQGEYVDLLASLAVRAASTGREEVLLSPRDRDAVGAEVVAQANARLPDGKLTLAEETRPMRGGLILRSGSVEVNGSFETILRLERPNLAGDIARILFPERGEAQCDE